MDINREVVCGEMWILTTMRSGRLERWLPLRAAGHRLESSNPNTRTCRSSDISLCGQSPSQNSELLVQWQPIPKQKDGEQYRTHSILACPLHACGVHMPRHTTHTKTTHAKIKFKKQSSHFLLCTDETPSGTAVSQPVGRDPRLKNPFTGVT